MKIRDLHGWNVGYDEAIRIQQNLREKLVLHDDGIPHTISSIAGADISYSRGDDTFFAAVVVLTYPELEIMEISTDSRKVSFPYIPGLLTFREGPPLLMAFEALRHTPDVIIFDGHGIAHPRGIGLASHMGLFLDKPTIGCAKKRLTGEHADPANEVGRYAPLMLDGREIGAAVRTKKNVKPVFVSQGHKIGLKTAIGIILATCTRYRLAEPTRRAHLEVNRIRRENIPHP